MYASSAPATPPSRLYDQFVHLLQTELKRESCDTVDESRDLPMASEPSRTSPPPSSVTVTSTLEEELFHDNPLLRHFCSSLKVDISSQQQTLVKLVINQPQIECSCLATPSPYTILKLVTLYHSWNIFFACDCIYMYMRFIFHVSRSSSSRWASLGELVGTASHHTPLCVLIQRLLFPIIEEGYKKVTELDVT